MSDIKLENVRLSFPSLTMPSNSPKHPESPLKYGCDFILEPSDPQINAIRECFYNLVFVTLGTNSANTPNKISMLEGGSNTCCYGDGNRKLKPDGSVYVGYENMFFINAKNQQQPQMITTLGNQAIGDEWLDVAGSLYSGCYANAVIRPYLQKEIGGLRCQLVAIQFHAKGDPFGVVQEDTSYQFSAVEGVTDVNPYATQQQVVPAQQVQPLPPGLVARQAEQQAQVPWQPPTQAMPAQQVQPQVQPQVVPAHNPYATPPVK